MAGSHTGSIANIRYVLFSCPISDLAIFMIQCVYSTFSKVDMCRHGNSNMFLSQSCLIFRRGSAGSCIIALKQRWTYHRYTRPLLIATYKLYLSGRSICKIMRILGNDTPSKGGTRYVALTSSV